MNEGTFKINFLKKLGFLFPESIVIKTDPTSIQGIPDRLVLYRNTWVALEFKRSANASKRANQEYYINLFNEMSGASFVFPENQEEVIHAIQQSFRFSG